MEPLDKIGTYRFVTDPSEVDYTGHMTVSALGKTFLDCAGVHAQERGFGILTLNENHCTWVLSRLVMEMEELPQADEHYQVLTWVEKVYKLFTDRNFELLDASGKVMGYARSTWAMIDLSTRRPVDLDSVYGSRMPDILVDRECPIARPSRIHADLSDTPVDIHRVKYSDIDINGHVNSIRYMDHILDLFPCDTYCRRRVSRFEIAYLSESHAGDELHFHRSSPEDSVYDVEVCKPSAEVVCRARIVFKEK